MKKFIVAAILWGLSFTTYAVDLTPAQKTSVSTYLANQTDPVLLSAISSGSDGAVADWLNANSTFIVWRTDVSVDEIYNNTGFLWTEIDGLTVGKRDEWKLLFHNNTYNPSQTNQRNAIIDVWSGTTNKNNVQAAILTLSKRAATRLESIFTSGTGTTATPGLLSIEGTIDPSLVSQILRP